MTTTADTQTLAPDVIAAAVAAAITTKPASFDCLTRSEALSIIADAKQRGESLTDVQPLALQLRLQSGLDLADPSTFLADSVEVTPIVNPLLEALLVMGGVEKIGPRTFYVSMKEKAACKPAQTMFDVISGRHLVPSERAKHLQRAGNYERSSRNYHTIHNELRMQPLVRKAFANGIHHQPMIISSSGYKRTPMLAAHPVVNRRSAIVLGSAESKVFLRICTVSDVTEYETPAKSKGYTREGLHLFEGAPDLDLLRPSGVKGALNVTPDVAVSLMEAAEAEGWPIAGSIRELRAMSLMLRRMVVARRLDGAPAEARIAVGAEVAAHVPGNHRLLFSGASVRRIDAATPSAAVEVLGAATREGIVTVCDEQISDVVAMEQAQPYEDDMLKPWQNEAVGIHLATRFGYVNGCDVGMGKTPMTLRAWRAAWQQQGSTRRCLLVASRSLCLQWKRESTKFFPEAHVVDPTAKNLTTDLAAADAAAAASGKNLIVIISYETARMHTAELTQARWDELAVDEATILKNPSAARSQGLWAIRPYADRAVALTGTSIEKSPDELGSLVAFVRGDRNMFHGSRLAKRFDAATAEGGAGIAGLLGAVVFRRDQSLLEGELPVPMVEVVMIEPEQPELILAHAARHQLKETYERLLKAVEQAGTLSKDDPQWALVQAELQKARGAMLGGVTLARMAASDPAAVQASTSAGAMLLRASGLVAPAVKNGGTKRKAITNVVAKLTVQGEATLIFTDFSGVANNIAADLAAKGVRVGVYSGQTSAKKRDALQDSFQRGELDALVLTAAGVEGLNLQRATVVVHYDLPWLATKLVQRMGRARRMGSVATRLMVLIPIMVGTIEERVVSMVARRALESVHVLDSHRGVDGSQTAMGLAVGALAETMADHSDEAETAGAFAMAAAVLAPPRTAAA